jgi:hypothetical protein
MGIISFFRGLFHNCDMEPVARTHSNPKGEVWIFQCRSCPKKVEGYFDSKGRCFSAKPIEGGKANGKA